MERKLGIHSMHPPYHDSTLIKVMMANGQQLQPMHALFPPSIPHGLSSLCSWEQVKVNRSTCTHHIQVSEDNMANAWPLKRKAAKIPLSIGMVAAHSKLQKSATLFSPMLQSLSCRGGLKKLCSFDLFPCIYAQGRPCRLPSVWAFGHHMEEGFIEYFF